MLEDCPFQLTAFTNSYFESRWLGKFWDMQPDIRLLSFPESGIPWFVLSLLLKIMLLISFKRIGDAR
jgi:hypothetical protein